MISGNSWNSNALCCFFGSKSAYLSFLWTDFSFLGFVLLVLVFILWGLVILFGNSWFLEAFRVIFGLVLPLFGICLSGIWSGCRRGTLIWGPASRLRLDWGRRIRVLGGKICDFYEKFYSFRLLASVCGVLITFILFFGIVRLIGRTDWGDFRFFEIFRRIGFLFGIGCRRLGLEFIHSFSFRQNRIARKLGIIQGTFWRRGIIVRIWNIFFGMNLFFLYFGTVLEDFQVIFWTFFAVFRCFLSLWVFFQRIFLPIAWLYLISKYWIQNLYQEFKRPFF